MQKKPQADFGVLMNMAFGVFKSQLHAHLAAGGYADVGPTFGYVFRILEAEAVSLRELAARLGMTAQGAHKVVEDMVAKSYVRREADPHDARVTRLRLTPRGMAAVAAARDFHATFEAGLAARYGARDAQAARRLFEKLVAEQAGGGFEPALRPV
jgi:DNA-binding MarR family transcriptional regulator